MVIFQLQDDHSRLAVASLVASSETSQAAIDVFDKGVAARGVPQRLLTDNGIALNPSRRGCTGRLVEHVRSLGVEPITSKPYHPTTQGKNERFHQTLFRYLDQQPLADSIAEPPGDGSTASTTSTTPSAPTRACPGASPRSRHGTPPRWPRHPDRTTTPPPSPQEAQTLSSTPPHGAGCIGTSPSVPPASAS